MKKHKLFIACLLVAFAFPVNAYAQVSGNFGGGSVVIGPSTDACAVGIEGAIRYNTTSDELEYCDGVTWIAITTNSGCGDTTPDAFSFTDLINQTASTLVTSNIVPITGLGCATSISIAGAGTPQYRVCADSGCSTVDLDWANSARLINNAQYVQLRLTSSATASATNTATLTIGAGTPVDWDVETAGPKLIFLTTTDHSGALGGLSGADAICQARADAQTLGGTFKAWLSDSTTDVRDRVTQNSQGYELVNGTTIANNWADLVDGTVDAPINRTETGSLRDGYETWTGSQGDGTATANHCDDWGNGTNTFQGTAGDSGEIDSRWHDRSDYDCDETKPLYCLQQ